VENRKRPFILGIKNMKSSELMKNFKKELSKIEIPLMRYLQPLMKKDKISLVPETQVHPNFKTKLDIFYRETTNGIHWFVFFGKNNRGRIILKCEKGYSSELINDQ
jgi:hypothetical protein